MSLRHAALILVALALTPALAFTDGATGSRTSTSSVVAHTSAYLYAETFSPTLSITNGYTANAVKIRNDYDSDATLDLAVSKTAGDARFILVAPTSVAGATAGQSLTVQVTDTNAIHTTTSTSITVLFEGTVKSGASNVGYFSVSRTVTVVVT